MEKITGWKYWLRSNRQKKNIPMLILMIKAVCNKGVYRFNVPFILNKGKRKQMKNIFYLDTIEMLSKRGISGCSQGASWRGRAEVQLLV